MFLLRHGQSYFNLHFTGTRADPGIPDPELTPLGIEQAQAAARGLADATLTRIIVSPYLRALQTAEPFRKTHQAPMRIMHEVRERADAFRAEMAAREDSPTTLLVSHWAFILALTGHSLRNGEVVEYDPRDGAPRLIDWDY